MRRKWRKEETEGRGTHRSTAPCSLCVIPCWRTHSLMLQGADSAAGGPGGQEKKHHGSRAQKRKMDGAPDGRGRRKKLKL